MANVLDFLLRSFLYSSCILALYMLMRAAFVVGA